jgi:branched-chain amino acid transport system substrate-binding protein
MKQSAEMALFDANAAEFELIVKDDLGSPEGARAAADAAVREGAEIILGPLLSASVEAVIPVASSARVPVVAFSNDKRLMRQGVYLLSFMPDQDVQRIVAYALANGRKNFAALVPDDAYGQIIESAFKTTVGAAQANIVAIERYGRGGSGTLEATRRLGEALAGAGAGGDGSTVADALLVPGEPETLTSLGPLIAYARIDTTRIKLLGTAGWDSPNIGRDPTFVGGWYPAADQRGWQTFSEKFTKSFGSTPPRLATLSFDAVTIALALSGAPSAERYTAAGLTRPSGFSGADGTIRFGSDGAVIRALGVYEVQAFGSQVLEAPDSRSPAAVGPSAQQNATRPQQVN